MISTLRKSRRRTAGDGDPIPSGDLVLMHITRAMNRGICFGRMGRQATIEALVRIAANAIFHDDRSRGGRPKIGSVVRWCEKKGLDVSADAVERIAVDEVRSDYLFTIEDRGEMLRITPAERIQNGVWLLGAYGETKEARRAAKAARQAHQYEEKLAASKAVTATKRGPTYINISAIAREFDLSRPTVRAYKKAFDDAILAGGNWTNFSSFLRAHIYNNRHHYNGVPLSPVELCVVLNISKSTLYNWEKSPGKIEAELKAARPTGAGAALIRSKKAELKKAGYLQSTTTSVSVPTATASGLNALAVASSSGQKLKRRAA